MSDELEGLSIADEIIVRTIPVFKGHMYFLPVWDENTDYRVGDRCIEGDTVYMALIDCLTNSTMNDISIGKKKWHYPYDKNVNPAASKKTWRAVTKIPKPIDERKIVKLMFGNMLDGAAPFEDFKMSLSSKRIYNKNKHEICRDNNAVLNFTTVVNDLDEKGNKIKYHLNKHGEIAGEFMVKYLYLKIEIDNPDSTLMKFNDHQVFITELMNIVPEDLVTLVTAFVEKYYYGELDKKIKPDHPYNMDTTFLDADVKQICIVKYLGNLLIPMCTHYCNLRPGLEDSIEFFISFYKELFKKTFVWSNGEVDALGKLHNLASSMVGSAYNQNAIMGSFAISGKTVESATDEIFSKILITKVTAVDIERSNNIAPFITNIIRKASNEYLPRGSKGYELLKGFSDDVVNSDGDNSVTSQAEKMESKISRPDELVKNVRKVFADDNIAKVAMTFGVTINPDELNFILNTNITHSFQTKFTFTLFSDRYSGYQNLYDINHLHYCTLVLIADNYLRKTGRHIIADFLTAHCDSVSLTQRWGGKNSSKKLTDDERYLALINDKYRFIRAKLSENNFILNDITSLVNSNFIYNKYGNPKNGQIISHSDDEIIGAVLDYYSLLV